MAGLAAGGIIGFAGTNMVAPPGKDDYAHARRSTANAIYGVVGLLAVGDGLRYLGTTKFAGLYTPVTVASGAGLMLGTLVSNYASK